jgi:hypothetical protein
MPRPEEGEGTGGCRIIVNGNFVYVLASSFFTVSSSAEVTCLLGFLPGVKGRGYVFVFLSCSPYEGCEGDDISSIKKRDTFQFILQWLNSHENFPATVCRTSPFPHFNLHFYPKMSLQKRHKNISRVIYRWRLLYIRSPLQYNSCFMPRK